MLKNILLYLGLGFSPKKNSHVGNVVVILTSFYFFSRQPCVLQSLFFLQPLPFGFFHMNFFSIMCTIYASFSHRTASHTITNFIANHYVDTP
jgi:hypothetical protein